MKCYSIYGTICTAEDVKRVIPTHVHAEKLLEGDEDALWEMLKEALEAACDGQTTVTVTEVNRYGNCAIMAVGRSWETIEENETGAQFRNSVQSVLNKAFGKRVTARTVAFTEDR